MKRIVDELLTRASDRADFAEVYLQASLGPSTDVNYEHSRLKNIISRESTGVALRVVRDGRIGLSVTTKLDDLAGLVNRAVENAEFGPSLDYELPSEVAGSPKVKTYSKDTAELPVQRLVEQGAHLIEPTVSYEPKAQAFSTVSREATQVWLANTKGLSASYNATAYQAAAGAEFTEGENFLMTYAGRAKRNHDVELDPIANQVAEVLRAGRHNVAFEPGKYPVIFTARCLGDLLRPFVACANGSSVARNMSPWGDRLGEKLLDERVTLVDDGTLDWGAGTRPFDDEGVPQQRTPLIEKGVLKSFYTDLRSAAQLGMASTGNGRRPGLSGSPSPSTTNPVMAPGDAAFDDMIAGMKEGLVVSELMGAWAGNPFSGEVSGNISYGLRVVNGKYVGRVKNCVFSLNAFEAFRDSIEAISSEREWFMTVLLPHVMLRDVSVSGQRG